MPTRRTHLSAKPERWSRRACLVRAASAVAASSFVPAVAFASTDSDRIAAWFFERYLLQSITVVRFNATRVSEEAGKAIEQEAPSLQRFLTKHRPAFVAALVPMIETEIPADERAAVAGEVASDGTKISARTRERLLVVDEEFQKNEQRLLRAMSYELNVLVETIVANIRKTP